MGIILHRVRKITPIYMGVADSVWVRYLLGYTPIYMGEILRRGTQNYSYIHGKSNQFSVKMYLSCPNHLISRSVSLLRFVQ